MSTSTLDSPTEARAISSYIKDARDDIITKFYNLTPISNELYGKAFRNVNWKEIDYIVLGSISVDTHSTRMSASSLARARLYKMLPNTIVVLAFKKKSSGGLDLCLLRREVSTKVKTVEKAVVKTGKDLPRPINAHTFKTERKDLAGSIVIAPGAAKYLASGGTLRVEFESDTV